MKSHGGTDAVGFYYSIDLCYKIVKGNLMNQIKKFKSFKKVKIYNLTKFEISKKLIEETGYSSLYSKKLVNDFFDCIKENYKREKFKLKNVGTFKVLNKKQRIGRNPKTKINFKISARKSLSFITTKKTH